MNIFQAVILLALLPSAAHAQTLSISFDPPAPTSAQTVSVVASGTQTHGPITLVPPIVTITGTSIEVLASLNVGNSLITTPFSFSIAIGVLPPGNYTVTYNQFVRDPFSGTYLFDATRTANLVVTAAPAAAEPIPTLSVYSFVLLVSTVLLLARTRLRRRR